MSDDAADARDPEAVSTLVGEQLRAARAEVFQAYLRSLEQARALGAEDAAPSGRDERSEHRHAS